MTFLNIIITLNIQHIPDIKPLTPFSNRLRIKIFERKTRGRRKEHTWSWEEGRIAGAPLVCRAGFLISEVPVQPTPTRQRGDALAGEPLTPGAGFLAEGEAG